MRGSTRSPDRGRIWRCTRAVGEVFPRYGAKPAHSEADYLSIWSTGCLTLIARVEMGEANWLTATGKPRSGYRIFFVVLF